MAVHRRLARGSSLVALLKNEREAGLLDGGAFGHAKTGATADECLSLLERADPLYERGEGENVTALGGHHGFVLRPHEILP
jgi:hypothetical protein